MWDMASVAAMPARRKQGRHVVWARVVIGARTAHTQKKFFRDARFPIVRKLGQMGQDRPAGELLDVPLLATIVSGTARTAGRG